MCTYACFLTQHLYHMGFTIYAKTIHVWAYTWASASRVCSLLRTRGLEALLDARVKCFVFVSRTSTPVSQPKSTNGVFHFYAHHSLQCVRERQEAPHCYGYMSLQGPHYIHQKQQKFTYALEPRPRVCMDLRLYACVPVCVCMYVRTHVCVHVCMHVCMHELMNLCMHVCMHVSLQMHCITGVHTQYKQNQ